MNQIFLTIQIFAFNENLVDIKMNWGRLSLLIQEKEVLRMKEGTRW